jgi:hypothetical protein
MKLVARYSVLLVPSVRYFEGTLVRKKGFRNEYRGKRVFLSWVGVRIGLGRFSQ